MKEEKDIKFRHSVPVQIRFNDLDGLGHVNNSVYLSFYDLGKSDYFRTVRRQRLMVDKIDVVIAHIDVDFHSPVFLEDEIEVRTKVETIGNKSFTLLQQIVEKNSGEIKCSCRTVMVGFDQKTHQALPISKEWREAFSQYEQREF